MQLNLSIVIMQESVWVWPVSTSRLEAAIETARQNATSELRCLVLDETDIPAALEQLLVRCEEISTTVS